MGMILRRVGEDIFDEATRDATSVALPHWHRDGLLSAGALYSRDSDGAVFGEFRHEDITEAVSEIIADHAPSLEVVYTEEGFADGFTLIEEGLPE